MVSENVGQFAFWSAAVRLLVLVSMAGFKDFRDIVAWQLAHELKVRVDIFIRSPPFRAHYKFSEQLSDAARSAPRNIAEGHGRFKHKEFAQFVRIAKVRNPKCSIT